MFTPKKQKTTDMSSLKVFLRSSTAKLPTRGSALAAGYDLYSSENAVIKARGQNVIPTDISIVIPDGYYGRVAPRSGLAVKHGIDTGAGVIDADYRGKLGIVLFNHSDKDFEIKQGDRIAQLLLEKITTPPVVELSTEDWEVELNTERGEGGFGSTGKN